MPHHADMSMGPKNINPVPSLYFYNTSQPRPLPLLLLPPLHTHAGIKADYRSGDLTPSFGSCNCLRKGGGWKRGGGG